MHFSAKSRKKVVLFPLFCTASIVLLFWWSSNEICFRDTPKVIVGRPHYSKQKPGMLIRDRKIKAITEGLAGKESAFLSHVGFLKNSHYHEFVEPRGRFFSTSGVSQVKTNATGSEDSFKENPSAVLLDQLLKVISEVRYHCKKMVSVGGMTCHGLPEGNKYACLEFLGSRFNECIIYSFGVGHDFTYELGMGRYGCHVFAFDDDIDHERYSAIMAERVYFSRLRLGSEVRMLTKVYPFEPKSVYQYMYRPLDNIMYLLDSYNSNIDILKIDIENDEWDVFLNSFSKLDVLERTQQLNLEIHFREMADFSKATLVEISKALDTYNRVFLGLLERGFRLAHYEANYFFPRYSKLYGRVVPIFSELLWINTRLKLGTKPGFRRPFHEYVHRLETS